MRRYLLQPAGDGSGRLDPVPGEQPSPEPGPGEVRIRVRAASLNYRDVLMRRGMSASSAGSGGVVPLSDGAGEIDALGRGVDDWSVGDRVAGCFFPRWEDGRFDLAHHDAALGGSMNGMLAEQVVLPAGGIVRIPDRLSFAEAACLPCAALTAWHALFERGALASGESVLVLGTGGVSVFALQMASAAGARVIVTSSSDAKLARAKDLGAWAGINYQTMPEWEKSVWELTGRRGVDHIVEVGGPGTLGRSMASAAAGGQIALIGVLTGRGAPEASLFPLVARNVRLDGIYVGSRGMFERMNAFLDRHAIRPVIDREFAFEEAAAAYDLVASGGHFGKVVIRVG